MFTKKVFLRKIKNYFYSMFCSLKDPFFFWIWRLENILWGNGPLRRSQQSFSKYQGTNDITAACKMPTTSRKCVDIE